MATNWYDTMASGNNVSYSNWNTMVPEIRHNNTGSDWYNMDAPDDITLDASSEVVMKDDGTTMFTFELSDDNSIITGGGAGGDLYLTANSTNYPQLRMLDNSRVTFRLETDGYFGGYYDGTSFFRFYCDGTTTTLAGGDGTIATKNLRLRVNTTDTYPYMLLSDGAGITIDTYSDIIFNRQGSQLFKFDLNSDNSRIYGGDDAGDDLYIYANSSANNPYIFLDADNDRVQLNTSSGYIQFSEGGTGTFKFTDDGTSCVIEGGATDRNMKLQVNDTDTYPNFVLFDVGDIELRVASGRYFILDENNTNFMYFQEDTDSIIGTYSDKNIYLNPNGSGVVKFGSHTALGGESVTGYITIKDASGNTRKLAVVS